MAPARGARECALLPASAPPSQTNAPRSRAPADARDERRLRAVHVHGPSRTERRALHRAEPAPGGLGRRAFRATPPWLAFPGRRAACWRPFRLSDIGLASRDASDRARYSRLWRPTG